MNHEKQDDAQADGNKYIRGYLCDGGIKIKNDENEHDGEKALNNLMLPMLSEFSVNFFE